MNCRMIFIFCAVQELTGITPAMLEDEDPISKVLPEFFSWIFTTTQEVAKGTGQPYHPGIQYFVDCS